MRTGILLSSFLFLFVISSTLHAQKNTETQPNILVFLVDDLGYGDLACYGHPFMITPNLDRLAEEGMRFTDFHSGAPICSPSRVALLTGRTPYRVGIWMNAPNTYMQDSELTIAEMLKGEGYQTFFTGKWHMSSMAMGQPSPGDQGFDQWMIRSSGKFQTHKGDVPYKDGASCFEVVDYSIDMLKSRNNKKPFFLEVCIREPHTPLTPPQQYMDLYDNDRVRYLEKTIKYGRVLRPAYVDENSSELARYYYGTVTQLDEAFGKLMSTLEELGVSDNTIVIFTSDNGPEHPVTHKNHERDRSWGTPGDFRGMKRFLYEGGHRVPAIVRWPGIIRPGSVSHALAGAVDLMPTLCEITGAEKPHATLDGTNILPVLKGYPFNREQPLYWNIPYTHAPNMGMRLGNYALLGYFDPPNEEKNNLQDWVKTTGLKSFELYNLENDPKQEVDLKDREHAMFVLMRDRMREVFRDIQEDGPTWPGYKSPYGNLGTRPVNEGQQKGIPGAIK